MFYRPLPSFQALEKEREENKRLKSLLEVRDLRINELERELTLMLKVNIHCTVFVQHLEQVMEEYGAGHLSIRSHLI